MKIVLIITRLDLGGSAEAVMQIGEGLSKKGHEVKIITGLTRDPQEDLECYIRRTGIPIKVIPQLRREVNLFFDLHALWLLYKMIKDERPEVVHTHTSKAGILGRWAAWLGGVKVIVHSTHGHIFYGYFGILKTTLFLLIERFTAKITDSITTLTQIEIEDYQKMRLAGREKFISIPYGIDMEKYQSVRTREEVRKMFGLSADDCVIGWVGRLVPVKDCGTFLRAASMLRDIATIPPLPLKEKGGSIRFLVVGDGPERKKMEGMAERLGLQVIFTGTRKDIYDIISAMDLLVLSSLNEGLGHVILEAMAAWKPVIATRVGGVPEVVEDGVTGILVPPSNPAEMASAIMKILADPEMMERMGKEGRKRAERFDIKMAVDRLDALYKNGGLNLEVVRKGGEGE